MNKVPIDINSWIRKDHYNFFSQFDEPFFGVTVEVDCTKAYTDSKSQNFSFFLKYLHCSLLAINNIETLKLRIENEEVWLYNKINASPTINRPDGTFGFAYIDFCENFDDFSSVANKEIEKVQTSVGLNPAGPSQNVIHYSSLPWIKFTSISHARSFKFKDSCPKISFGKIYDQNERKIMPISIHVHHALVDGYHIGLFVEKFQELLNH